MLINNNYRTSPHYTVNKITIGKNYTISANTIVFHKHLTFGQHYIIFNQIRGGKFVINVLVPGVYVMTHNDSSVYHLVEFNKDNCIIEYGLIKMSLRRFAKYLNFTADVSHLFGIPCPLYLFDMHEGDYSIVDYSKIEHYCDFQQTI